MHLCCALYGLAAVLVCLPSALCMWPVGRQTMGASRAKIVLVSHGDGDEIEFAYTCQVWFVVDAVFHARRMCTDHFCSYQPFTKTPFS